MSKKKKAAWTVMVYLAGDNNLSSECLFALTEMKKAAPGERIRVIAQFDPQDNYLPTHRYEINRKGPNSTLFEDIIDEAHYNPKTGEVRFRNESKRADSLATSRLKDRTVIQSVLSDANDLTSLEFKGEEITDDTDTGSPVTLYNFLSFCIQEYPADHYMVVLSGHAGGTESDYLLKDESSKGSLTFNELKQVFRELKTDLNGQPIDILGMDNCLMSMGEICYELRGLTQIVVGCESYSPASGWPYREILERLRKDFSEPKAKGKSSPVEAAKAIVEEYVNYYANYWMAGVSVTQSALDLGKVEKFRKIVDRFANELERGFVKEYEKNQARKKSRNGPSPFQDALLLAHWEAQSYNGESFVDLYDFCDCLERRVSSDAIARKCAEVKKFLKSEFVLKSCYSGSVYQYSHGVSIYFPWAQVASSYGNLDFIKDSADSGWGRFLKTYTTMTRREPRGLGKQLESSKGTTDRMAVDRMAVDRMAVDRMAVDRMAVDRMAVDRMAVDRMGSVGGGNPIHSMRNPPVIFFPTQCIRNRQRVLASQERLLDRSA